MNAEKSKPWKPEYERWRHGGWYTNVRYPSGACGCVSRNYADKKWRIVCREEAGTFATRNEATYAERALAMAEFLELIAKRCDEAAIAMEGIDGGKFRELRDFSLGAKGTP